MGVAVSLTDLNWCNGIVRSLGARVSWEGIDTTLAKSVVCGGGISIGSKSNG